MRPPAMPSPRVCLALLAASMVLAACSDSLAPDGTEAGPGPDSGGKDGMLDVGDGSLDLARDGVLAEGLLAEGSTVDAGSGETGQADMVSADALTWLKGVTCSTAPPPGALLAAALPAYGAGTCPVLQAGTNTISSSGSQRQFILAVPASIKPGESLPVLFMWHWLKGSAKSFLSKGEVQTAVDKQRFIAVIPESKDDLSFFGLFELPWPFTTYLPESRMDEEYKFFDDMLACVGKQYAINTECVSTVGVSAGALFTAQLAAARSQHLASFVSLSGGVSSTGLTNIFIRPFKAPTRKLPALVLWGGPLDSCALLNFQAASQALEKELTAGGHFFVECIHNCMHGEPPLTPLPGQSKYEPIWDFAFKHPFWLKAGQSPYQVTGWPTAVISWCGLGAGSATIRTGSCPPPGCPI